MAYRRSYKRFSRSRRPRKSTFKRKRYATGRKRAASAAYNTVSNASRPLRLNGFRNKHIPYRAWMRNQIRATDNMQHFRSIQTLVGTVTTGAATGTWVGYRFCLSQLFWTTGGGFQPLDTAGSVVFPTDLMVRGGKYDVIISNLDEGARTVEVTSWLAKTKTKPVFSNIAARTTLDAAWDPSCDVDFQTYWSFGKPVTNILEFGDTCSRVEFQPTQKIDQGIFNTDGCERFMWIFKVVNVASMTATTVQIESRHSVSFTGDVF